MNAPFDELRYPFTECGFREDSECELAVWPQIRIRFDAVVATRSKVGFAEFGTASTPPRLYLQKRTTYRCYNYGTPGSVTRWANSAINPATGETTNTTSTPAFTSCAAESYNETVSVTRTLRRTVWTRYAYGNVVESRLEMVETLNLEYTTERLIADTLADLDEWGAFPDDPPGGAVLAYYVQSGICATKGESLFNIGASRLVVPTHWHLPADRLSFTVQETRYRLVLPPLLGDDSTFAVAWEEVFVPDSAQSEDDWEIVANGVMTGGSSDIESNTLSTTTVRENGEVFVRNARYTALNA